MRFGRCKFTCKNHPWDWASPCDGLCTGTWGPTGGAVACPSSFAIGGCWLVLTGGHLAPLELQQCLAGYFCTATKPVPEQLGQKSCRSRNENSPCAQGWLRGHREMGLVMVWERSVPPAPEAAQCKVQCFCCGQRWAHINMPTSVLKPLKCRHTLASNCSGESGPLGAVTF